MVGTGGGSFLSSDERYSGNKSRFSVKSRSLAEENAFDVKPLRKGIRSGYFFFHFCTSSITGRDFVFRTTEAPVTGMLVASVANLAKGALGGGVLAGHVAYMTAGYLSGISLNLIYGVYMCFNFYTLVISGQRLCRRAQVASMTYPDIGEAAFALFPNPKVARWSKCYRIWIDFITCLNLFGSCAAYQLMVGKTLKQLVENTQKSSLEGLDGLPSLRAYVAMMIIPTIAICLITELKYLAPFSLGANAVIALAILMTINYAFKFNPNFDGMVAFTNLYDQIRFTGMSVFSMSCAGVVIPVENNMKEPQKFYIVMLVGYMFIIGAVFSASFFGYTAFTDNCESPITMNFPMETFPKILKAGIAVMIYVTHAVNFFMPFNCVFFYLRKRYPPEKQYKMELFYRACIVIIIALVAIAFPNIDALMGFLGCFCLSNMAFICPNTIYVLVHYERPGLGAGRWRLWRSIGLSLFGVFILICGSIVSGGEMVSTLFGGSAATTEAAPAAPEAPVAPGT